MAEQAVDESDAKCAGEGGDVQRAVRAAGGPASADIGLGPASVADRLAHPLCGVTFGGLQELLGGAARVPPSAWPWLGYYGLLALLRAPFTVAETTWLRARRPATPAPLVIVGHWRSGTTHLHNVLAQAPRFAHLSPVAVGLPAERLLIGRPLEPLLHRLAPADRGIDAVAVARSSPQEDEIPLASLGAPSYYHAYYLPAALAERLHGLLFPDDRGLRRWQHRVLDLHRRLASEQPGRRPLIKNPVYTGRLDALRAIWPDVQVVHCVRHPAEVYASTLKFHRAMLQRLSLHAPEVIDLPTVVLDTYVELLERFEAAARRFPQRALVEVRFEELQARPLDVLARIYDAFELTGFGDDRPRFERYLASVASYRPDRYRLDARTRRRLKDRLGPQIRRLGYDMPDAETLTAGATDDA